MKKKFFSLLISMTVIMNLILPVCAYAADGADNHSSVYIGNGYIVYYDIKDSWDNNQNVEIQIKNTGSEPILNWALKYDAHGEISGLWNGTVNSQDSTKYIIKNSGYNYEILPDQTADFGYSLSGENLEVPKSFEICSKRTDKDENEYTVSLNISEDWNTGFTGEITIENLSASPIEAWRINFDSNFTIDEIWNASMIFESDDNYCIANDVSTTPIGAYETKKFGFKASKGLETEPEIKDCFISEVTIRENFDSLKELETGLAITAFANYNSEENAIDVYWTSTIQNGKFKLLESSDNSEYSEVIETSDFMFYHYMINENFSEKYFIVKQTTEDGRMSQSDPLLISNNGSGYTVGFPDSDGDGIPDYFEKDIGTDVNKADTDDDGLTDYEEFYLTGTDPTVYDSVTNGVSDNDADSDNDGLSNRKEIELGTNPLLDDTDKDRLSDGAEVTVHGTDPLKEDTDDDGINDGDEIDLGLDPLNPETFGVPDSEYIFEADVPSDIESFADVNNESNPFEVSLKVKAAGNILANIDAKESDYSKVMTNDATLGICPEFIYDEDCKIEEAVIQFKIDEEYVAETDTQKSETSEFYGIKKYNIFKFFEDTGTLLPVKTDIDEENGIISTTVDSLGSYCVIDMEKFLNSLDDPDENTEEKPNLNLVSRMVAPMINLKTKTFNSISPLKAKSDAKVKETNDINVFFFVDNRSNEKDFLAYYTAEIESTAYAIFNKSKKAEIFIITCDSAGSKKAYTVLNKNNKGYETFAEVESGLMNLSSRSVGKLDNCVLSDALSCALKLIDSNKRNFGFYIFNQENLLFREEDGRSLLDQAVEKEFDISIVSKISSEYVNGYALDLYKNTGGIYIKKDSDFTDDIINHIYDPEGSGSSDDSDSDKYNMLLASGLQQVKLNAPITENYKAAASDMWENPDLTKYSEYADTDDDGLYDFQEIDLLSDRIKFVNGKLKLPTIKQCIDAKKDLFYVDNEINRLFINKDSKSADIFFNKTCLVPILSDPTSQDTDGDGFVDYYEYKHHEKRNTSNSDTSVCYLNGLRYDSWQPKSDMARLVKIAGFEYDPQQKIIQSSKYPIQRFFGFSRSIDMAADNILSSAIYCDPICFFYDGKEYMLELWKGQYGLMSGAEVGLYYRKPCRLKYTATFDDIVTELKVFMSMYGDDMKDTGRLINQAVYDISHNSFLCIAAEALGVTTYKLIEVGIDAAYDASKMLQMLGLDSVFGLDHEFEFDYADDYACNYKPEYYYDEKWYRSVADEDMIDVSYKFETQNAEGNSEYVMFERKDRHWWTTGFEWGKYTESENHVTVSIKIDFHDEEMKEAFINGGQVPQSELSLGEDISQYLYNNQKLGLNSMIEKSYNDDGIIRHPEQEKSNTEVVIEYKNFAFNAQPQDKDDKIIIQGNNLALEEVYKETKKLARIDYDVSSLFYTNDPNMITVDNFMSGFSKSGFFSSDGHIEWLKNAGFENTKGILSDWRKDTFNNLLTNLASNAISKSYGINFYGTYFNVINSADPVLNNLGIEFNAMQLLYWIALPGMNLDDLGNCAKTIASSKYTDGNSTKYLYEYYEEWYENYISVYDIDYEWGTDRFRRQMYYNVNHFPGMIYSTNFVLNKVLGLRRIN